MKLSDKPEMPRGFPRPKGGPGKAYPTPYTSESVDAIDAADMDRLEECANDWLCVVCGLPIGDSPEVWIAIDDAGDASDDHGLSHEKCSKIVTAMCPAFKPGVRFTMKKVSADEARHLIYEATDVDSPR